MWALFLRGLGCRALGLGFPLLLNPAPPLKKGYRHPFRVHRILKPRPPPLKWYLVAIITPAPYLPAPNARSSECAAHGRVLVVVDVVEVNAIMCAGMDSLVVDVVEMRLLWVPACIR